MASIFKVVLLGDPDVGKTSILLRYTENEFSEVTPSLPVSEKRKKLRINGKEFELEIWDTAGQERYKSLDTHYYRDADAALLIYNVADEESFTSLCEYWLKETQRYLPDEATIPIQLVGNKCDIAADGDQASSLCTPNELVPLHLVNEYTEAYGILRPIECSAKTGHNISKIFNVVAGELFKRHIAQNNNRKSVGYKLSDGGNGNGSCCS